MTKSCSKCGTIKLLTEFYSKAVGIYRRASHCKKCHLEETAARYRRTGKYRAKELLKQKLAIDPNFMKCYAKNLYHRKRGMVLDAYGHACVCCGETQRVFLAIDHVNNDGAVDRKNRKIMGTSYFNKIIREGYPASYQLLCHNCNWAKSHGGCPHVQIKTKAA